MVSKVRRYELTDEEWEHMKPYIPEEQEAGSRRRPSKDSRQMLNEIFWILRSEASWRDLPERYGPWQTVYKRFMKWSKAGIFEKNQCIGITRGGRNTKIHAVVDALGNPIHVQLSSGDIHDENIADDVLDHVDLNETIVQADKAYGSYRLREYIADRNADFCIPPKSNTIDPWFCDYFQYKERHLVECFFNKLKENRRISTRFDKLASRFLTFVHLACIRIMLA